jgi:hypothetical protein
MSREIQNIAPKVLQEYRVTLYSNITKQNWDITKQSSRIDIYENIFSPHLTGELQILDDSNLISEVPILGQETIFIFYKFKDTEVELVFNVAEVMQAKQLNEGYGAYVLKLVSIKQFLNATNIFSRSYSGRNTDIISQIHSDFLQEDIEVLSEGGSAHNIVFPFIKPYNAITNILKNTYSNDSTPLFLWESVLDGKVRLQSLGDMMFQDTAFKLQNINNVNTSESGEALRSLNTKQSSIEDAVLKRAFPTFNNIKSGNFASNITTFDIANKTYAEAVYNYVDQEDGLSLTETRYTSEEYKFNELKFSEMTRTNNRFYNKNTRAYNTNVGNLYNNDSVQRYSSETYKSRMNNNIVQLTADTHPNIRPGILIDLDFKRMKPNLDVKIDRDPIHSGTYMCSAIKHTIKPKEYSVKVEAIRAGINDEVEVI